MEIDLKKGERFGNYYIERYLASGGQAKIYLAIDVLLHRKVAIKVFTETQHTDQVLKEARLIAQIHHPNILSVYQIGFNRSMWWMAIEYLPGKSLYERILRLGPMNPIHALSKIRDLAEGLSIAHEAGILHRDLKPHNFLCTQTDDLKLADFGLAEKITGLKQNKELAGTPDYLAPEVWQGKGTSVQSDLYSLGASLFFMITGRPPFHSTETQVLMQAHIKKRVKFPSKIPAEVKQIIEICMRKSPANRPSSARELIGLISPNLPQNQTKLRVNSKLITSSIKKAGAQRLIMKEILKSEFFSSFREELQKSLTTKITPLIIIESTHHRLLKQVLSSILDEHRENIYITARFEFNSPTQEDLLREMKKVLNIKINSRMKIFKAIIKEIVTDPSWKGRRILQINIKRLLSAADRGILFELAREAESNPVAFLITTHEKNRKALLNDAKISELTRYLSHITLPKISFSDALKMVKQIAKSNAPELYWSKDALLLCANKEMDAPDPFQRITLNCITVAREQKMSLITTWCVFVAVSHANKIFDSADILPKYKYRPTRWPPSKKLNELKCFRIKWQKFIRDDGKL